MKIHIRIFQATKGRKCPSFYLQWQMIRRFEELQIFQSAIPFQRTFQSPQFCNRSEGVHNGIQFREAAATNFHRDSESQERGGWTVKRAKHVSGKCQRFPRQIGQRPHFSGFECVPRDSTSHGTTTGHAASPNLQLPRHPRLCPYPVFLLFLKRAEDTQNVTLEARASAGNKSSIPAMVNCLGVLRFPLSLFFSSRLGVKNRISFWRLPENFYSDEAAENVKGSSLNYARLFEGGGCREFLTSYYKGGEGVRQRLT